MSLTVEVWRFRPDYKVITVSILLMLSILIFGLSFITIGWIFIFIVMSCLAVLIPISIASRFGFGRWERCSVKVLCEVELSAWDNVKVYLIAFLSFLLAIAFLSVIKGHYYSFVQIVWSIVIFLILGMLRFKVKVTDLGVVMGKTLILGWDDVKKVKISNGWVILKGRGRILRLPMDSIPKEVLNNIPSKAR
ncbi:hypothetical protein [Archaeoglobus sp.]